MNDIEILENYVREWHETDVAQAIENILKERQADKEKIKELEEIKDRYLKLESDRFWDNVIPKSKIRELIERLEYDINKTTEVKIDKIINYKCNEYDKVRLKAYITKSKEFIKRLEKLLESN